MKKVTAMPYLPNSSSPFKPKAATLSSTLDWQECWQIHGTSWRELIDLHFTIIDRMRSADARMGSSS
jgi:hypothetical protein